MKNLRALIYSCDSSTWKGSCFNESGSMMTELLFSWVVFILLTLRTEFSYGLLMRVMCNLRFFLAYF